jgi:hypothetical protein
MTCTCIGDARWSEDEVKCKIDCTVDAASTGAANTENSEACACIATFFWDPTQVLCQINCSEVTNSSGIATGVNACPCAKKFMWNATTHKCVACSELPNTDLSGAAPGGRCACIIAHAWSTALGGCIPAFSCFSKNNTNLTVSSPPLVCICIANFKWNATSLNCEIDCSKIKAADLEAINTEIDSCICKSPSFFNTTSKLCVVNCLAIPFADVNSAKITAVATCFCKARYYWNADTLSCDLNCSRVTFADPNVPNPTPTTCVCSPGTNWNSSDGLCWVNCTNITNGRAATNPTTCTCTPNNYAWNSTRLTCTLDCASLQYYAAPREGVVVPEGTCSCQAFFIWDSVVSRCRINCAVVYGTEPAVVRLTDGSCRCLSNFYWAPGFSACLPICSRFANSNGTATVNKRACFCNTGYTWRTLPKPTGCVMS